MCLVVCGGVAETRVEDGEWRLYCGECLYTVWALQSLQRRSSERQLILLLNEEDAHITEHFKTLMMGWPLVFCGHVHCTFERLTLFLSSQYLNKQGIAFYIQQQWLFRHGIYLWIVQWTWQLQNAHTSFLTQVNHISNVLKCFVVCVFSSFNVKVDKLPLNNCSL